MNCCVGPPAAVSILLAALAAVPTQHPAAAAAGQCQPLGDDGDDGDQTASASYAEQPFPGEPRDRGARGDAAVGGRRRIRRPTVPFVPPPPLPIAKPWIEGIETGLTLSSEGNTMVRTGDGQLDEAAIPSECPELEQPSGIHFMVINLDQSKNRRRTMRRVFADRGLPAFERVPGVLVTKDNVDTLHPRRLTESLKMADYGCALAHRRAWQRLVDGPHDWAIVLEDDAELVSTVNYTQMPKVPKDADMVLFRARTIMRWEPVCVETSVMRAYWGFGMVAYLLSKAGAARLLTATADGLKVPLDGKIWYSSSIYTTRTDYISHPPCANPCPSSVRTWLNKELPAEIEYPD